MSPFGCSDRAGDRRPPTPSGPLISRIDGREADVCSLEELQACRDLATVTHRQAGGTDLATLTVTAAAANRPDRRAHSEHPNSVVERVLWDSGGMV